MASNGDPYPCPHCGNQVGTFFAHPKLRGLFLLDTGGGSLADYYRGLCKQCGGQVHFSLNTQLAARLFKVSVMDAERMMNIDKNNEPPE